MNPDVQVSGKIKSINNVSISAVPSGFLGGQLNGIIVDLAAKSTGLALQPLVDTVGLYLANDRITDKLQLAEDSINRKIAEKLLSPSDYANWMPGMPIVKSYTFPAVTEDLLVGLSKFLNSYDTKFPISYAYLKNNNVSKELYYAFISGDTKGLAALLRNSAACEASKSLSVKLQSEREISNEEYQNFCTDLISGDGTNLGNAEIWDDNGPETNWKLTPGTNLDIGVLSIRGNKQPFMKQVKYKTVPSKIVGQSSRYPSYSAGECYDEATCRTSITAPIYAGNGTCKLEMRVYKNDTNANGLKPIIAIHGGSWRYRGFGFFGLESQISHLTKRGYVVFAPFYRLAGKNDGNVECNGANGSDIISDIKSALTWVEGNAQRFGASGKVDLFGQSAGAQLSAYLAVHESTRINSAMLLYPPTDMKYYLDTQDFSIDNEGTNAIKGFLGQLSFNSLADLKNSSNSFILENSLPTIIATKNRLNVAPMYIMHGISDSLVPYTQSTRLCDALSGVSGSYNGGNPASGIFSNGYNCGEVSKLRLFAEADHIMDIKCIAEIAGDTKICRAGSKNTAEQVRQALDTGYDWLETAKKSTAVSPVVPSYTPSGGQCTWQVYNGSGYTGGHVEMASPIGVCANTQRITYYSGSVLVKTEYK